MDQQSEKKPNILFIMADDIGWSVRRSNTHPEPSRPENRNMNTKTTQTAAVTVTLALGSGARHAIPYESSILLHQNF